jgi:hypothetical protein
MMQCDRTDGPSVSTIHGNRGLQRPVGAAGGGGEGGGSGRGVEGGGGSIGRWQRQGRQWAQQGRQRICGPPLSLTSHLLTFHFSLLRALEKTGQKKKTEEERLSILVF